MTQGEPLQQRRFDAVTPDGIGGNLKLRTLGQCLTFRDRRDMVSTLKTALALMSKLLSLEVVERPWACEGT